MPPHHPQQARIAGIESHTLQNTTWWVACRENAECQEITIQYFQIFLVGSGFFQQVFIVLVHGEGPGLCRRCLRLSVPEALVSAENLSQILDLAPELDVLNT